MRRRPWIAAAITTVVVAAMLPGLGAPASAAIDVIDRISGADRYETSAKVSAANHAPGAAVAYVASGVEFADALSGAAAAGIDTAPILLTAPAELPASVAQEVQRLQPGRVIVLGGEGAVSESVAAELTDLTTADVERIAGADRYETSAEISAASFAAGAPVAFLASGEEFADALSGASVAGGAGGPILLTRPGELPAVIGAELARLRPAKLVILGGSGAVSEAVAAQAAAAAGVAANRYAGPDRYATSAAISSASFSPGAPVAYLASGTMFPDALSGAAAAAGAPLLLTRPGALSTAAAQELIRLDPARVVILGGTGAVSAAVDAGLEFLATTLPQASAGRLTSTTEVRAGTCLPSPDGSHRLCVAASGVFGVYRGENALWTSGVADTAPLALRLGSDGNAVLYSTDGRAVWQSGTAGTGATELAVQNDGDLMLRTAGGAIVWSSMSSANAPRWSLPFASGQRWSAGGPHTNNGTALGARGSIDFGPLSGGDPRVRAIADGTVYSVQCGGLGYLGINHAGGWQSTYYHLTNYQTQLVGTYVTAGTYLGDVARTVPCGGGATFDHVHLTIRRAGNPVSVEGMSFGGYQVHSSGQNYWGWWTDSATGARVLTSSGGAWCCLTAR